MRILRRNKDMIRFSGRKHTRLGIISAAIGIGTVIGLITISVISGISGGNGGLVLGIIGICLFSLAIFGFVLSYKAFKQKDIFYLFPVIGALLNGFMTVLLLIIYILGFGG